MDKKEQIQRAKELLESGVLSEESANAIKADFPELAESEDERIRKSIILLLQRGGYMSPEDKDKAYAWLEKQKEQPTDAKSERVIEAARRVLNNWLDGTDCPDVSGDFAVLEYAIREYDGEEKQKEQKQAEWSEEDKKTIHLACEFIRHHAKKGDSIGGIDCSELVKRLKSLRPYWKPSEEQPEVDLEKEIIRYQREDMGRDTTVGDVARHFYELGKNSK